MAILLVVDVTLETVGKLSERFGKKLLRIDFVLILCQFRQ